MKLSISIICLLSFCLVTLVVQKQVQGAKGLTYTELQDNVVKLWLPLENLIGASIPVGGKWDPIYNTILLYDPRETVGRLVNHISEFTEHIKAAKTAILDPVTGLSAFDNELISDALKKPPCMI
jgi:hypothetical protein